MLTMLLCLALGLATALTRRRGWQRQVSAWWRLMPVVFVAWWLQPWGVWALVGLVNVLAALELAPHAGGRQATGLRRLLLGAGGLLAVAAACHPLAAIIPAALTALVLGAAYRRSGQRPALLAGLFALQAAGLWCLPLLARWPTAAEPGSAAWFFHACTVTALSDIAQFVSGKCWGRHALAPRISPNKTWQGLLGGLVASMTVSWALGRVLDLAATPALLGLGVLLCVSGLLGDLLFSAGKRAMGLKDYSDLIPGHGGILDRVDSLVLSAPALLLALWAMQY